MPTYRALCSECNVFTDYVRCIADRDTTPECCGTSTTRVLVAPMIPVMGLADHYQIKGGDGNTYYGKHEYQKYLDKNNLVPLSDIQGEAKYQREEIAKQVKREQRKELEDIVRTHS